MVNNSYLCTAFPETCTRSSMDRIKDSGSFDKGSIPFGCTNMSGIAMVLQKSVQL